MQILVHRDYFNRARARTHTHIQVPARTSILTTQNLIYTTLNGQQTQMDKDSSAEQKTWQVYSYGKRNVFRLRLNESREGFCGRKGWSFHVDGPKTEKAPEPTVEPESGARNLEAGRIISRSEITEWNRKQLDIPMKGVAFPTGLFGVPPYGAINRRAAQHRTNGSRF